jgi:hypothetical protein
MNYIIELDIPHESWSSSLLHAAAGHGVIVAPQTDSDNYSRRLYQQYLIGCIGKGGRTVKTGQNEKFSTFQIEVPSLVGDDIIVLGTMASPWRHPAAYKRPEIRDVRIFQDGHPINISAVFAVSSKALMARTKTEENDDTDRLPSSRIELDIDSDELLASIKSVCSDGVRCLPESDRSHPRCLTDFDVVMKLCYCSGGLWIYETTLELYAPVYPGNAVADIESMTDPKKYPRDGTPSLSEARYYRDDILVAKAWGGKTIAYVPG